MFTNIALTRDRAIALAKIITLGLLLGLGVQFLFAWSAPSGVAPTNNVPGPLTTGVQAQYKTGYLGISSALIPSYPLEVGGNALISGKVYTASTIGTDPANTLVTKDYVDALGGGVAGKPFAAFAGQTKYCQHEYRNNNTRFYQWSFKFDDMANLERVCVTDTKYNGDGIPSSDTTDETKCQTIDKVDGPFAKIGSASGGGNFFNKNEYASFIVEENAMGVGVITACYDQDYENDGDPEVICGAPAAGPWMRWFGTNNLRCTISTE